MLCMGAFLVYNVLIKEKEHFAMIKKIEGTGYKYDPKYRFYGWEYADDIKPIKDCGAATIGEFYLACLDAWNLQTCSERLRPGWSEDNPSVGQCTITAAIVHEFFGGEVLGLPLLEGGMHSFNRLDGKIIDLACEQFGKDALLDFDNSLPVDPDSLLAAPDKAERAALLKERILQILHS